MRFRSIHLHASPLAELASFYRDILGWPVDEQVGGCAITIGRTTLHFQPAAPDSAPTYHFAVNISRNKLEAAKGWLAERTPLVPDERGRDELHFKHWDARAVYFRDPAGNIGELIARATLETDREGGFAIDDLHGISEIGLVTTDPTALVNELRTALRIRPYEGSEFFLGDEEGMFVLPAAGYPWLPDRTRRAEIHPVRVCLEDPIGEIVRCRTGPFVIEG